MIHRTFLLSMLFIGNAIAENAQSKEHKFDITVSNHEAVTERFIEELGKFCKAQNIEMKAAGALACDENFCLLTSGEQNTPPVIQFTTEFVCKTRAECSVSVSMKAQFQARPQRWAICYPPSYMPIVEEFEQQLLRNI